MRSYGKDSQNRHRRYPLTLWDENVDNLFQELSSILDDLFTPSVIKCMASTPTIDFYKRDGVIVAEIELPGIDPDDIDLRVYRDRIVIKALKNQESDYDEDFFLCSERYFGKMSRVVHFPAEVDPETAKAAFKNGVLRIEVKETGDGEEGKNVKIELEE